MPAGFSSRLRTLLEQGRLDEARLMSRALSAEILSEEVRRLPPRCGLALCSIIKPLRLAALLRLLTRRERQKLLNSAAQPELKGLFLSLPEDVLPMLLADLPSRQGRQLVEKLPSRLKKLLEKHCPWPHGSVGWVMSEDGVTLSPDDSVAEALAKIRREAPARERVFCCFVIDGENRFVGTAALENLVLARPDTRVIQLTERDCHAVSPECGRLEAARLMSRYDVQVLPVVHAGKLVGILPFDDVLDVIEDENTQLFHHAGGVCASGEKDSLWGDVMRRFPCLLLCLLTGILSTGIMEKYEHLLGHVVALSFFIPLLIDTGGNTGAQASALVIRALGLGGKKKGMFGTVLRRELITGILLGAAMALLAAARAVFLGVGSVACVVASAMICVVAASNLLGVVLPFAAVRLKLDPALLSGPLLTTIVDVMGLMLYFAVARLILL